MIVSEYGIYNNKAKNIINRQKPVSELPPHSNYRVDVQCPECMEIRSLRFHSVTTAGHCICLKCMRKLKARKHLTVGTRYGMLVVIGKSDIAGRSICQCDCGFLKVIDNYSAKAGHTVSCGCKKLLNFANAKRAIGESHGMWRGGVSGERARDMQSGSYKEWRRQIFERDNYTCQKCGQVGYALNAHHIESYKGNENKRTDINNGVTLCRKCHIEFHGLHGRKDVCNEMLQEYISASG